MIIYALKEDRDIFYIGKTRNIKIRMSGHITQSFDLKTLKDKKIQSILESGKKLEYDILKECDDIYAAAVEEEMIKRHVKLGHKLLNVCFSYKDRLTHIEEQVLILMADDKESVEIAKILRRSVRTIETVRLHIRKKAKIKTLSGLMIWGIREGYISL